MRHVLFGVLLALMGISSGGASEDNVSPGINRHYENADFSQWRGIFERDGREVFDYREQIIEALALKPGLAVADIGAGTGLFTRLMAAQVGDTGRIYAVDITRNFVESIVETSREQGFENVIGVVNDQKSTHLPANSVDLVFISDTYHHFEYPLTTMRSVYQAVRPGGRLVVIDFIRKMPPATPWVMGHVRAGKAEFRAEIESVGFVYLGEEDFMRGQYFLRFAKPAAASEH